MKILLTILFFLACAPAQAVLIPTTPIGKMYNDGTWYKANSSYISSAARGGFAFGFNVAESYRLSSLSGFIMGADWTQYQETPPGTLNMTLYQGSRPDHNNVLVPSYNIVYTSDYFSVPLDGNINQYSKDFDYDLTPGDYWLGFTGGSTGYMVASGYQLEGMTAAEFAEIHNPEPATLALMGGGLAALWRRRRASSTMPKV